MLDRVQATKREIERLDRGEFRRFSSWFAEYEAAKWDTQIEQDFAAGEGFVLLWIGTHGEYDRLLHSR